MNRSLAFLPARLAAAVALLALGTASPAAFAQETKPAAKPAATAQKPAPKQAASCPAGAKCAQGTQAAAKRKAVVPPPSTAEQIAALPEADEAQVSAAELVHYGKYVCDEKFEVFVERNPVAKHYVDVRYKKDVWVMKPVASATGAVRLEDTRGAVLLVQIPVKSMLLNTQTGQRLVDSCQHDIQKNAELESKAQAQAAATDTKN